MGRARWSAMAFAVALAAFISSEATAAECGASKIDACLVGAWRQSGGGAAEWMRENMKTAQVKMSASNAVITLNRDGTFSTSQVDANAEVTAESAGMQASAHMTSQGSGKWSAVGGTLTLCMDAVAAKGSAQIKLPNGTTMTMAMPETKPSVSAMSYNCSGDALSTEQPMHNNTSMTTTYSRVQ